MNYPSHRELIDAIVRIDARILVIEAANAFEDDDIIVLPHIERIREILNSVDADKMGRE